MTIIPADTPKLDELQNLEPGELFFCQDSGEACWGIWIDRHPDRSRVSFLALKTIEGEKFRNGQLEQYFDDTSVLRYGKDYSIDIDISRPCILRNTRRELQPLRYLIGSNVCGIALLTLGQRNAESFIFVPAQNKLKKPAGEMASFQHWKIWASSAERARQGGKPLLDFGDA